MKLSEVQRFVAERIAEHPELSLARYAVGNGIVLDDGDYPQSPGREEALAKMGLVFFVWQIQSLGNISDQMNGTTVHEVSVPVVVEAVRKNAAGVAIEQAVEMCVDAVLGKGGRTPIRLASPSFQNMGLVNGVHRYAINFVVTLSFIPNTQT
jgi:hypothetical protein